MVRRAPTQCNESDPVGQTFCLDYTTQNSGISQPLVIPQMLLHGELSSLRSASQAPSVRSLSQPQLLRVQMQPDVQQMRPGSRCKGMLVFAVVLVASA